MLRRGARSGKRVEPPKSIRAANQWPTEIVSNSGIGSSYPAPRADRVRTARSGRRTRERPVAHWRAAVVPWVGRPEVASLDRRLGVGGVERPGFETSRPAAGKEGKLIGMTTAAKGIVEAALKLDPKVRAEVAEEILDSLEESNYGELSPAWEKELDRRVEEIEEGRVELLPAEQV
jgi:putative addiction module component (TIGR02574 family)